MTLSRFHKIAVTGIRVLAILYLLWNVYKYITDTVLLRNTKNSTQDDVDDGTGILRSVVNRVKGAKAP